MPLITLHDSPPHKHTHHIGMTPLERGSARHRDLYLTTHKTHNKQTFLQPAAFESAIPTSEQRPQTHVADRVVIGIGQLSICNPETAIEARRKGKLILYSLSDLSKSYLYWQYMNIDILCTHRRERSKIVCTCNKDRLPINIRTP